jgi:hypothetical protein
MNWPLQSSQPIFTIALFLHLVRSLNLLEHENCFVSFFHLVNVLVDIQQNRDFRSNRAI